MRAHLLGEIAEGKNNLIHTVLLQDVKNVLSEGLSLHRDHCLGHVLSKWP